MNIIISANYAVTNTGCAKSFPRVSNVDCGMSEGVTCRKRIVLVLIFIRFIFYSRDNFANRWHLCIDCAWSIGRRKRTAGSRTPRWWPPRVVDTPISSVSFLNAAKSGLVVCSVHLHYTFRTLGRLLALPVHSYQTRGHLLKYLYNSS